jgi:hypothetical protein
MFIQGTLRRITDFKKLIVQIDEKTYKTLETAKAKVWTQDAEEGETKYYVRISLDRYDRNALEKKFEPLLGKEVNISAFMKDFDFVDDESEQHTGKYLLLKSISKRKPTTSE